jgi:hypothetical protein
MWNAGIFRWGVEGVLASRASCAGESGIDFDADQLPSIESVLRSLKFRPDKSIWRITFVVIADFPNQCRQSLYILLQARNLVLVGGESIDHERRLI